ncbi:toll/interleukin-1 receptor domain-containing protein [Accumulibacter sp.]|uniref:toll/interleukin-1 receptor domain-containing protein n=1 Tax=Accumulibacter sp. TaxID=2053492 RepID=UPI001A502280|nr:toll/interleukin-1 receptor domain-containing protein [Accumulibacter sp.]MBL8373997.1 toll/interleukin-1 receptor domain-containing protein [Accumulibacter sp.]
MPRGASAARPAAAADGPLVFVSYARENSAAARAIADRLLELGAGDVWLDKKKLRGGDDWSTRIDQAIAECDYFLPLLSSEADQRREGVFWEEWASALRRARRVADTFLLPTLIDADPGSRAHYQRIGRENGSERFFQLHLLRAPAGVFDASAEDDLGSRFTVFRRS